MKPVLVFCLNAPCTGACYQTSSRESGTAFPSHRHAHQAHVSDTARGLSSPDPYRFLRPISVLRHLYQPAFDLKRFFGQTLIAFLPDPVRINSSNFTRCSSGYMGKHRREISKWLLECEPRSAQIHGTFAPHVPNLASSRNADPPAGYQRIVTSVWPICRQSVAIILVAVGRPVARRNSAITSRPEKHCSAPHGSSA